MALPPGMSVRAISQATITDRVSEGISRTTENRKLIHNELNVCGSEKARTQFSTPQVQGCPGAAVLKLPASMNVIGSAMTRQKNSRTNTSATRTPRSLGQEDTRGGAVIVLIAVAP